MALLACATAAQGAPVGGQTPGARPPAIQLSYPRPGLVSFIFRANRDTFPAITEYPFIALDESDFKSKWPAVGHRSQQAYLSLSEKACSDIFLAHAQLQRDLDGEFLGCLPHETEQRLPPVLEQLKSRHASRNPARAYFVASCQCVIKTD